MNVLDDLVQVGACVVVYYGIVHLRDRVMARRENKRSQPKTVKDRVVAGETITYDHPVKFEPRPIDPQNPPRWLVYNPKRPGSVAFCSNCGDALEPGEKALFFSNTRELICEGCVKTQ